jgi:OsmC subfamily peroxiredoxin
MTRSAGLLLYRRRPHLEVLLVHPGGPFFQGREAGVWSLPKGEMEPGEDPLAVAHREFSEETGHPPPEGQPVDLGTVVQAGGKTVLAWAVEGDLDPTTIRSNTFTMEWPPRSGQRREFPEVDRAGWFDLAQARRLLHPAQVPFLDRLVAAVGESDDTSELVGDPSPGRRPREDQPMAAVRWAESTWTGDLMGGAGTVTSVSSGVVSGLPVSWASRTGEPGGRTSPEELLAAAHAACFSMALANGLAQAGTPPRELRVRATVTFDRTDAGWRVVSSHLRVTGVVPGADATAFVRAAEAAKEGCPVSQALKGNVALSVEATLEES